MVSLFMEQGVDCRQPHGREVFLGKARRDRVHVAQDILEHLASLSHKGRCQAAHEWGGTGKGELTDASMRGS